MLNTERLIGTIRAHRKSIVYLSSALVLASAGTASAATVDPVVHGSQAGASLATTSLASALVAAEHGMPAQPLALHAGSIAVVQRDAGPLARHYRAGHVRWLRHPQHRGPRTIRSVLAELNLQASPALAARGITPAADRLLPVPTAGPQNLMPIAPAQYANAATIVHQALARSMGVRSAVIAVATAMQESRLLNLGYGTGDSLGLFQQQWDMGWGTPQQIMNPAYAAGKFLDALHSYQAADPAWASQPLYQAAQGVQRSALPFAYAQWERQAAQLTAAVLRAP